MQRSYPFASRLVPKLYSAYHEFTFSGEETKHQDIISFCNIFANFHVFVLLALLHIIIYFYNHGSALTERYVFLKRPDRKYYLKMDTFSRSLNFGLRVVNLIFQPIYQNAFLVAMFRLRLFQKVIILISCGMFAATVILCQQI